MPSPPNQQNVYEAFEIGEHFRILPPEVPLHQDGRIELITARGAFGSGEHETTANCLEELMLLKPEGARVLDFGTGTGILAVAALKLGARRAVGVDIDPRAIKAARQNAELNEVDIELHLGDLDMVDETGFDLVLANIYADVLLGCVDQLLARTASGGSILMSGVPWEYDFDVQLCYERANCTLLRKHILPDYMTLVWRSP
jgi:ribosomal protein L11 methyltransferase